MASPPTIDPIFFLSPSAISITSDPREPIVTRKKRITTEKKSVLIHAHKVHLCSLIRSVKFEELKKKHKPGYPDLHTSFAGSNKRAGKEKGGHPTAVRDEVPRKTIFRGKSGRATRGARKNNSPGPVVQ